MFFNYRGGGGEDIFFSQLGDIIVCTTNLAKLVLLPYLYQLQQQVVIPVRKKSRRLSKKGRREGGGG